ncbi:MAG: alpha-glucosidase [Propionicimonas sp.]
MESTATPWWKRAVVYQIYPRSFADSDGDGVGDLPGIIGHLDYLADLGVDVVWLSPIYRSPMDDNGYDISDYDDVDPLFGTLADLDALIAGLHARGMKLVMDLVVNHTSDEHPWFVESRDPSSPKRDWYYWRAPRPGHEPGAPGAEPTNWGSFFSGPGWSYDETSGEYYLHLFSRKQPDLNWENPAVRAEVYALMNRWVDRGVDGFRMDVINLISKTLPLVDGVETPEIGLCYDPAMVTDGPRMHEFLREMNREVGLSERDLFTVGEMVLVDVEHAREYTATENRELGMVFTFEHMTLDNEPGQLKWKHRPARLVDLKRNLAHWQDGLAERGWNSLYFENHDQPRSVSRFGDDAPGFRVASAKSLATVLHLLKGTPYIFQGQELGMRNAGLARIEQYQDLETTRFHAEALRLGMPDEQLMPVIMLKSRDNARTPMPWDATANAGFSAGTPWLPVNADSGEINAAAAVADPGSVFHHYRALIALRHDLAVVREGRFDLLLPGDERLFAYTRTLGDDMLLVVANLASQATWLPAEGLPSPAGAQLLLGTHDNDSTLLQPWESRVYRVG